MYKIKTLNKIDAQGLKRLPEGSYLIDDNEKAPDAIIVRSFKMHDEELPESLKAIGRAGAGVNNIPIERCTAQGVVVFNAPGANANAVKELVVGSIMFGSRRVMESIEWSRSLDGKGDEIPALVEEGKKNFAGQEASGKTIAVLGLGAIGVLIANACVDLGMHVIGYDPYLSLVNAVKLNSSVRVVENFDALLGDADYLTLHVPETPDTKGFVNADLLAKMKSGIKIFNFARGGLCNDVAIHAAINAGKVSAYFCDFPDAYNIKMPKTYTVAHLGASTAESETNCAIMVADQVKDYLENGNVLNSVNFPAVNLGVAKGPRLTYASMQDGKVAEVTAVLSAAGVQITNMVSKNRANVSYSIIDLDSAVTPDLLVKLKEIEGLIMVRVIR
ncbi:MAG: 3-phosphoglycerate dehydrogenase family protein [Mangrovibacterium sp.]